MGLSLLSQPVQAASITFSFDDSDNDLSIIVKNVDGIQLTMSNSNPAGNFRADSDGVCVAGNSDFCTCFWALDRITSLNLTFDAPVQLISYNIGFNNHSPEFGASQVHLFGRSSCAERR